MQSIKRLMVCLDLTEMDAFLIHYASFLAKSLEEIEQVFFVHNIRIDFPEELQGLMKNLDRSLEEIIAEELNEKIKPYFSDIRNGLSYEVLTSREDSTASALVEASNKHEVDLVITGKKSVHRGSGMVSVKLLRNQGFDTSLLLIPQTAYHRIQKILVPVDFSTPSKKSVERGLELKDYLDADLVCQHVFSIPAHYFPYIPVKNIQQSLRKNAELEWEKFSKTLKKEFGQELSCELTFSNDKNVAETIYDYSMHHQIDLIVIGSKGKGAIPTIFLGSVALRLIQQDMHIPVWVIR